MRKDCENNEYITYVVAFVLTLFFMIVVEKNPTEGFETMHIVADFFIKYTRDVGRYIAIGILIISPIFWIIFIPRLFILLYKFPIFFWKNRKKAFINRTFWEYIILFVVNIIGFYYLFRYLINANFTVYSFNLISNPIYLLIPPGIFAGIIVFMIVEDFINRPMCSKCGRRIPSDSKKCPHCGVDLKGSMYTWMP